MSRYSDCRFKVKCKLNIWVTCAFFKNKMPENSMLLSALIECYQFTNPSCAVHLQRQKRGCKGYALVNELYMIFLVEIRYF